MIAERETCEEQNPIPARNEARASRIELAFLVTYTLVPKRLEGYCAIVWLV